MRTCKTCKWWGVATPNIDTSEATNAKVCDNPDMKKTDGADYETIGDDDFAIDGDHAGLLTGPDFGCTKWEVDAAYLTTMMDLDGVG